MTTCIKLWTNHNLIIYYLFNMSTAGVLSRWWNSSKCNSFCDFFLFVLESVTYMYWWYLPQSPNFPILVHFFLLIQFFKTIKSSSCWPHTHWSVAGLSGATPLKTGSPFPNIYKSPVTHQLGSDTSCPLPCWDFVWHGQAQPLCELSSRPWAPVCGRLLGMENTSLGVIQCMSHFSVAEIRCHDKGNL